MKFRAKPCEVDAIQFTKLMALDCMASGEMRGTGDYIISNGGPFGLVVRAYLNAMYELDHATVEVSAPSDPDGYTLAFVGDWIIQRGPLDFYVLDDKRFKENYDPIS